MQSRRLEDFAPQSPAARVRDRRLELGADSFSNSRRDAPERRSLSPQKLDVGRRIPGGDRRSGSVERRDYGWHLGGGGGGGEGIGQLEIGRRGEVLREASSGFSGEANTSLKNLYGGYDHSSSRVRKDKALSYSDTRLSGSERHGMLVEKENTMEDGVRGYFRLAPDLGPASNYDETGGPLTSAFRDSDISRYKDETFRYRNSLPADKLPVMESSYKEGEKPMMYTRDISYTMVPSHRSKEIPSNTQFKEIASTSLKISRADLQVPYQDDPRLPSDEFPRKQTEPLGFRGYGRRQLLESERNSETELTDHQDYLYSKILARESDDYVYPSDDLYRKMPMLARVDYDHKDSLRPGIIERFVDNVDDIKVSSGNLRDRGISRHPTLQEQSSDYLDMKRTPNASKQGGLYLGSGHNRLEFGRQVSRDHDILNSGRQASRDHDILNSGRQVSRDHDILNSGVVQEHELSRLRSHYVSGGDANPVSQKERLKIIPVADYDMEMHRLAIRRQRMKGEEHDIYDASDRILKRKHSMEEEVTRYNSRSIISSKWYTHVPRRFQGHLGDSVEEMYDEDLAGLASTKPTRMERNGYRHSERIFDGRDHRSSSAYDWLSSQDPLEYEEERPIKSYKPGGRYIKGQNRPSSLSWNNSYHFDKRSYPNKQHKVWKRIKEDYYEDVDANENDFDPSEEDWENPVKSEPPEDSEEFKQMVHKSFLKFSKKLNEHPSVRRRYKEQGQAGSLFCIVCGRSTESCVDSAGRSLGGCDYGSNQFEDIMACLPNSSQDEICNNTMELTKDLVHSNLSLQFTQPCVDVIQAKLETPLGHKFPIIPGNSKEFMDTQRLVTHAYMSHKFGLRADHLGLHKAICVLLGWNSIVPPDTITWVPHVLPGDEALTQKEDLILWPPLVIIHNISISNSDPEEWKLVTIEALGAFLRGKGFGGGKFKMCLGKPADHSVMVVKFLGTFSGLEDAVKLHKYYAGNNHGRADLEKINYNNGKSSSSTEAGMQPDKPEEVVLYGYMGIAEDLDKLDFDSKRRCLIQSKQEIRELADAPVKPD
ncbi:hypothetical protein CK203_092834 [Vitis vinifera]|uniref:XS domain-containing protein n=1 Tax=Vitis vinifera TaxID=29760 RepID=A0A438DF95_VITVI|nr:hypothetical protein CK203_092834 [Vitis vinifera]